MQSRGDCAGSCCLGMSCCCVALMGAIPDDLAIPLAKRAEVFFTAAFFASAATSSLLEPPNASA